MNVDGLAVVHFFGRYPALNLYGWFHFPCIDRPSTFWFGVWNSRAVVTAHQCKKLICALFENTQAPFASRCNGWQVILQLAIANEFSHKRINPVRILFLEDNFVQRQQLTEYLEKFEHDVLGLASAPEALEVLKTTYVDAVISDVYIRAGEEYVAMGGLWLLRSIRLKGRDRALLVPHDIPFLAISGGQEIKGGYSPLRSARDLGADFWLKKPVDEQELLLWLQDIEIEIARKKERS